MAIRANQQQKDIHTEPGKTYYTSNILKLFVEGLESRPQAQVLDVGPACEENILFFARRAKHHYVCDMFLRLARCLDEKRPVNQIWQYLDYPPESFDGILLWELADRLDDPEVSTLAKFCQKMLKPGGRAVVLVLGEQAASSMVNSFVIGEDFRVYLRPQRHLHLPMRSRQNRDVLTMMAPLVPTKSFMCRPGFIEFLFRRD